MEQERFDHLARAISVSPSRRQVLRLLSAVALVAARPGQIDAQDATSAPPCAEGLTFCAESGACVDLTTDLVNCGACGSICESGLVAVACRDGECVRASCPVGITYCGAVAGCRNLAVDPGHCGACGNACPPGLSCLEGRCGDPGERCLHTPPKAGTGIGGHQDRRRL